MQRSPDSKLFLIISLVISFVLHALGIAAAIFLIKSEPTPLPFTTPVRIVNLPPETLRSLPPVQRPVPFVPTPPQRDFPAPKKFGTRDDVTVPRVLPPGAQPGEGGGGEQGGGKGTGEKGKTPKDRSPLPFLTQRDIDDLARKGMPKRAPGDDSVTLDTDEFKFISYNRWLKIHVESRLRYPELAARSGYQGVLYIHFDIMKDGSLGTLELLKSSGYKILDDEALQAIRSSAPFQPLPDEWHMDHYSIRAAVIFYINDVYVR